GARGNAARGGAGHVGVAERAADVHGRRRADHVRPRVYARRPRLARDRAVCRRRHSRLPAAARGGGAIELIREAVPLRVRPLRDPRSAMKLSKKQLWTFAAVVTAAGLSVVTA